MPSRDERQRECRKQGNAKKATLASSTKITMKLLSSLIALIATTSVSAFAPAPLPTSRAVTTKVNAAEEFYIDDERRFVVSLSVGG